MTEKKLPITTSSGNVFEDLELKDARELTLKAQLVLRLQKLMKLHRITQKEMAKRCHTDQPTISKVLRGRLDLVTTDRLIAWLTCLDQDIAITVKDGFSRDDAPGKGHVSVYASC